jgi:hypothetical protein
MPRVCGVSIGVVCQRRTSIAQIRVGPEYARRVSRRRSNAIRLAARVTNVSSQVVCEDLYVLIYLMLLLLLLLLLLLVVLLLLLLLCSRMSMVSGCCARQMQTIRCLRCTAGSLRDTINSCWHTNIVIVVVVVVIAHKHFIIIIIIIIVNE